MSEGLFTRLSHLSKYFGFCFRKGEIINTEQRKLVSPESLDKNKKENKHV